MIQILNRTLRRKVGLPAALGVIATLVLVAPAGAVGGTDTGTVSVTASNAAKITMALSSDSNGDLPSFGSGLDPAGATPNAPTGTVVPYTDASSGAYYVWSGKTDHGVTVAVKSNKAWTGTLLGTESSGTADGGWSVASGALRFAVGAKPTSYAAASGASQVPLTGTPEAAWATATKGTSSTDLFFSLRVGWGDEPPAVGTQFSSTVTFTASQ
ncbi:MAG: hypothetical protein ACYC5J_06430 [Chloroflexota bacterium]